MPRTLEVTFGASGAAAAGARGRAVVVVDIVDASTSAEVATAVGATEVLGAAPAGMSIPVEIDPGAIGTRAAASARLHETGVVVVAEPRVGGDELRLERAAPVVRALARDGIDYRVIANQGAEIGALAELRDQIVVIVSSTGGSAFDAAVAAGSPAVGFATTARVKGADGWDVTKLGARRAIAMAAQFETDLSIVAASPSSTDDVLAAFELAKAVIRQGFLKL